jgi:hypothetical protein
LLCNGALNTFLQQRINIPEQRNHGNNVSYVVHAQEEAMGGWRKVHNEELYNLYVAQNMIKMSKRELNECSL